MIIVLATTFYVRTIKTKLDTKVDAMFQLVQSLVNEVNLLKVGQRGGSKPNEVIQLDINSSNKSCNNELCNHEESDDDDDESYEDTSVSGESEQEEEEEGSFNKTVQLHSDSPHQVNIDTEVNREQVTKEVSETIEQVDVVLEELDADLVPVDLTPVEVDVAPVEVEVTPVDVEVTPVDVEVKAVQLEPLVSSETQYDKLSVKELKDLVSKKGGKVTGKKKKELIEYLLS
jgi:uncharacterized phage infection (PIP) family protein YhgE